MKAKTIPRISVIDGHVPDEIIDKSLAAVPAYNSKEWRSGLARLPLSVPGMAFLGASIYGTFSQYYTDVRPDIELAGARQLLVGESIVPHREPTACAEKTYHRRLGVVLFLNDPSGGALQLWDVNGPVEEVDPVRGRIVIYDVEHYHAVTMVEAGRRLSIEMYLTSKHLKVDQPYRHSYEMIPTHTKG